MSTPYLPAELWPWTGNSTTGAAAARAPPRCARARRESSLARARRDRAEHVLAEHAVTGPVRRLAYELALDVRIDAVAPGATTTDPAGAGALGSAERVLRAEPWWSTTAPSDPPQREHRHPRRMRQMHRLTGSPPLVLLPSHGEVPRAPEDRAGRRQ